MLNEPDHTVGGALFQPSIDAIKFNVTHEDMTLSILNTTAKVVDDGLEPPTILYDGTKPYPLFADIYELVAATDISDSKFGTAYEAWQNAAINTQKETSASVQVNPGDEIFLSGYTPYQVRTFNKYWKIIKKTRVYIGVDEQINYKMNGRKGHFHMAKADGKYANKGWTKDLIVVVNPTRNENVSSFQVPANITWNKNYNYKVPDLQGLQLGFKSFYTYTNT